MKRPFKYIIICDKTKKVVSETDQEPQLHHVQTWEETADPKVRVLKQTKTVYVDTRYEAKMRLFNYWCKINKKGRYDYSDLYFNGEKLTEKAIQKAREDLKVTENTKVWMGFLQHAYYVQTGVLIPLLP